jgi:hypothetical protein
VKSHALVRRLPAGAASLLLLAIPPAVRSAPAAMPACMAGPPAAIVVRIGDDPPRHAWLRGGVSPPLEVVDADSSLRLWSGAAWPPASQQFDKMRVQFAGSLLPLDLDGDGIHDRIYAGDLAGRLWRFDLNHGKPAGQWASGGVFADLSSGTRGFVAAPDVSLHAGQPQDAMWFDIALGTVGLGPPPADNRFYVLRDRAPFQIRTQDQYDRWQPLTERDLVQLPRLGATLTQQAPDGYYIVVGGADVLGPALTVSGRATLALAQPGAHADGMCSIAAVVSAIDLATGGELQVATADDTRPHRIPVEMKIGDAFTLLRDGSHAACFLGDTRIAHCDADLSPRRLWWRREDAD